MVLFPSPIQLAALRRDPKFADHEAAGLRVVFVGMHAKQPPLDDVRVRSALLHAVDLKAILANILEGAALPARGVLAPGVFGFKDMRLDQLYPFDRGRAKALLAQAGWNPGPDGVMQKGGQRLTLTWLAARGRYPKDGEITEAVQAMLRDVGVEAKVEWREWASAFTQFRGDPLSFHLFTLGWVTSSTDADSSLYPLFHSRQLPPGGWNTSRYANARVDMLVEHATKEAVDRLREHLGLDKPLLVRYAQYVGQLARGDLGRSIIQNRLVVDELADTWPATLELTVAALLIAALVGVPAGVVSAVRHNSSNDALARLGSLFGLSMPVFWTGLVLIVLFSLWLPWLPVGGRGSLAHLVLPAVALALPSIAMLARLTRSSVLEVLHEDYVRTARAKGLQ